MQFKILHRCYATNCLISKWDHTKSAICAICNKKANISNNFFECVEVKTFWNFFETWYADTCKVQKPSLDVKDILLGKFKGVKYDCLNHMILYGKYFLHLQFVKGKNIYFKNFVAYYNNILEMEKQRYIEKQQVDTFQRRFGHYTAQCL